MAPSFSKKLLVLAAPFLFPHTLVLARFLTESRRTDKTATCGSFNAAPAHGRVWTLCEGKQFRSPTHEQKIAGVKASNKMKCTAELSFEQLCCLDFANVETAMTVQGGMMLDLAQVEDDSGALLGNTTTALLSSLFVDDARKLGESAPQITLCSTKEPTPTDPNETAVQAPVDCVAREFTVDEIRNAANVSAAAGGNVVLNARIDFLMKQGLPDSAIPLCTETVQVCPCSGKPPSTAGQAYLDARPRMAGTPGSSLLQRGEQRGFFSALQTSGSFVMMQAGGF